REEELEQRRHPGRCMHLDQEGDRSDQQCVVGQRGEELRRNDRVEPAFHPPSADGLLLEPPVGTPALCARLVAGPGVYTMNDRTGRRGHFPAFASVYSSAMPRPIQATIHPSALASNLALARAAAPGARVWAVLKADGYGHGLLRAAAAFAAADGLALLEFD